MFDLEQDISFVYMRSYFHTRSQLPVLAIAGPETDRYPSLEGQKWNVPLGTHLDTLPNILARRTVLSSASISADLDPRIGKKRRYLQFAKKHAEFMAFYLNIELLITSGWSFKSNIQLWHVCNSVRSANSVPHSRR